MIFPSFTFFNLYSAGMFILTAFVIAKILTLDWKLHLKENLYIFAVALVGAILSALSRDINNFYFQVVRDVFLLPFLLIYFYKIKGCFFRKAIIFMIISSFILALCTQVFTMIFYYLFPEFDSIFIPTISPNVTQIVELPEMLHISLLVPFSGLVTIACTKMFKDVRMTMMRSSRLQNIFICVGTVAILNIIFLFSYMRYIGERLSLSELSLFPYDILVPLVLLCFYFIVTFMDKKHKRQIQEERERALQHYTYELEQQQSAMRKFKHDYKNILFSLDGFIKEKKWDELEEFFETKIKTASTVITNNDFALEALSKINVSEVKSLLTAKLAMAHNKGIDAAFEAREEVDFIPVDSVTLVRMLGIILDNAIEEVAELGKGVLRAAYYKEGTDMVFIVQNTCRPGVKLGEIEKSGFSTKGKGRGLGMKILSELVFSCSNVARETSVEGEVFTQKLIVNEIQLNQKFVPTQTGSKKR